MKQTLLILALLATFSATADEKYMPNIDGGYVVLTDIPCLNEEVFEYYAYATIAGDVVVDDGCWSVPDLKGEVPPKGAMPIVNTYWQGELHSYFQTQFTNIKFDETYFVEVNEEIP